MYHPLFFFEAQTGSVLSPAQLRPGNASASAGIAAELERLVPILKQRFPNSQISYRADAGSATPEIYRTLESFEMLYAIGIASNSVFKKRTAGWLKKATRKYARTKVPLKVFYSFRHRAGSWNKQRRIVVKIEVGPLGTNVRFVITNRPGRAEEIYDGYDERGECENRIKEFKRDLSSDRLSCHSYRANAFDLNCMRLLTNCWCCSVSTPFEPPTSLMRGWKPYGLSSSRWGLGFSAPLVTCGFISPQAGPDTIGSWRCGKNLDTSPSLRPVKPRSQKTIGLNLKSHNRPTQGCSPKTRFYPARSLNPQPLFATCTKFNI